MPRDIKPFNRNPDGSVEWQCHNCSEPLLMYPGDHITVVVGDNGVVDGVLCVPCAKQRDKEGTDGM